MAKTRRTLEDFFANKNPEREEYVTVEGRPVMEADEEGKTATLVKPSGVLKKDLQTGKEVAELSPINVSAPIEEAQAPRPKSKLEALLPPKEEVAPPPAARAPESPAAPPFISHVSTGPKWWERLLVGATPALVGLLSGNELEGITLSGQQLASTEADLYKRGYDLDSKIAEMQAQRKFAGVNSKSPNFARQNLYDAKSGKTYVHSIVNGQDMGVLGEAAPTSGKDSFQKAIIRNPESGRMEVATINPRTKEVSFHGEAQGENTPTQIIEVDFQGEPTMVLVDKTTGKTINYIGKVPEKKSPYADMEQGRQKRFEDQKLIDLTKEFVKPTGNYNKMKENLDGLVMAAEQLNLGNPRANAGLQNYLARNVYGEKGPLSDNDIARLSGDPSYAAVLQRFLDARVSGKLNELDRGDIRQILDLAYKTQVAKMQGEASRFGNAFKTLGYDPTAGIQAYVQGSIKDLPSYKVLSKGNRSLPEGLKVGTVQDGYRFKGGDPSMKENWEKQ